MSILCYHAVDPHWRSPLAVTPAEFEAHCEWLSRNYTVLPLDVALHRLNKYGHLPRGQVALTFDDGFAQLGEFVFPTLARYRLPATVFLVVATLTPEGHAVDWVDTPPSWTLTTLTAEQVRAARTEGVLFASHSWAHRTLTGIDPDACREDLARSREYLADLLGEHVPFLAYPRGRHSAQVRRFAADAGFSHALALPEAREPIGPYSIPRVGVFPGNGVWTLRAKVQPQYLTVRHSQVFPVLRKMAGRR